MIKNEICGNIFDTKDNHIIFALNTEGFNDAGFAGAVSKTFPEIANTGGNQLGEILSKTVDGKTFHGIVCHSLENGWENADEIILKAINEMSFTEDASIVEIGSGLIGIMSNAPRQKITKAFKECNKNLTVYSLG